MLALFSASELLGRFGTNYLSANTSRLAIILASFIRMGCIYTSIMIGFNEEPKWLFDADWFKLINTFIIGFGNGFLATILMMIGPYKVSNMESERAG